MSWIMYAYKYDKFFMHFGPYQYVKLHELHDPIVKVELTESPNGTYYGWLENGQLVTGLTWPSDVQFEMCFPYGSEVEEEYGKGKRIRLTVKEVKE